MATTAIFAELLVIGLMVVAWAGLGVIAFVGVPRLVPPQEWAVLATVAILALAYVLGIQADRLADTWTNELDDDLRATYVHPETRNYKSREMRLRIMKKGPPSAVVFLDYARSRRRISRSAIVNAGAAAVLSAVLLVSSIWLHLHVSRTLLFVVLAVSAALALTSFYSWCRTGQMYFEELSRAYLIYVAELAPPLPPFDRVPSIASFLRNRQQLGSQRRTSATKEMGSDARSVPPDPENHD